MGESAISFVENPFIRNLIDSLIILLSFGNFSNAEICEVTNHIVSNDTIFNQSKGKFIHILQSPLKRE